jgi:hypothetical protein
VGQKVSLDGGRKRAKVKKKTRCEEGRTPRFKVWAIGQTTLPWGSKTAKWEAVGWGKEWTEAQEA